MKGRLVILILIIVLLGGVSYVLQKDEGSLPTAPIDGGNFLNEEVTLFRTSEGNEHTYRGVLSLPTPCHTITTEIAVAESFPEQIFVNLVTSSDAELCAQVITDKEFVVTFSAHPEHAFSLSVNGESVPISVSSRVEPEDVDGDPKIIP